MLSYAVNSLIRRVGLPPTLMLASPAHAPKVRFNASPGQRPGESSPINPQALKGRTKPLSLALPTLPSHNKTTKCIFIVDKVMLPVYRHINIVNHEQRNVN